MDADVVAFAFGPLVHQAGRAVDVADDAGRVAAVTRVEREIAEHLAVRDQLVARGASRVWLMQQDDGDAELARAHSEPCSGSDRGGLRALLRDAKPGRAKRDGGVSLTIDRLHLERVANHGIVGKRVQQLQHCACFDAAGRIETDMQCIDNGGEASARHRSGTFVLDRDAQAVAPCAGVERLHVEQRISFDKQPSPSGCARSSGRSSCTSAAAAAAAALAARRWKKVSPLRVQSLAQWRWLRSPCRRTTSSRSGTGRGGKDERSGLDRSDRGRVLSPHIRASRMRADQRTREDHVAGIGARCGAVRNRRDADELVVRRIADAKMSPTARLTRLSRLMTTDPAGAAAARVFRLKRGTT